MSLIHIFIPTFTHSPLKGLCDIEVLLHLRHHEGTGLSVLLLNKASLEDTNDPVSRHPFGPSHVTYGQVLGLVQSNAVPGRITVGLRAQEKAHPVVPSAFTCDGFCPALMPTAPVASAPMTVTQ